MPGNALFFGPGNAPNTWTHVAVSQVSTTSQTFKDGLANVSSTRTYTPAAALAFTLGSTVGGYTGQIDEVWCAAAGLSRAAVCRICSCGVREQCTCSGRLSPPRAGT
jgi:hypothetical protein